MQKKTRKVSNISELRDALLSNYENLENKKVLPKEAKTMSDIAGKVMSTCRLEMSYAKHHGRKKKINFMER